MTADLTVTALRIALARRERDGAPIVHDYRVSQFRSRSFQAVLKAAGHPGLRGRLVSAGDSAAVGSYWALLRRKVLNTGPWCTRVYLGFQSPTGSNTPPTEADANKGWVNSARRV